MLCGVFWEWRGLPQSLVTLGEMIMKDHESWWFSHACQFFYLSDFFMDSYVPISKKGWFLKFNIIDIDIDIDR